MKVLLNIAKGFVTVKSAGRLVVLLYLLNLGLAMVLAVPMHDSLSSSLGRSQAGEQMERSFDYLWWEEYRDRGRGLAETFGPSIIGRGALLNNLEGLLQMTLVKLPSVILLILLIYILLHTFLAGGILAIYKDDLPRFDLGRFLQGALSYLPNFLGLTVLSWVFFFGVAFLLIPRLGDVVQSVSEGSRTELPGFWLGLAAGLITWILFLLIQMVFDYARIQTVFGERRNIFRALAGSLAFVARHPLATVGLSAMFWAGNILISVIYVIIQEAWAPAGPGGVLLTFAWQQVFILGLVGLRCWTYAGELHLARFFRG